MSSNVGSDPKLDMSYQPRKARYRCLGMADELSVQEQARDSETTAPERRPVILAVDDDPSVLAAVSRDLRRGFGERFRVMRAPSGAEALEIRGSCARAVIRSRCSSPISACRRCLRGDGDYRANQAQAQQAWAGRHGDYWREYRAKHPDYTDRNRLEQRRRDRRRRVARLAKMDASTPISSGSFRHLPSAGGGRR